jgi:RNA polymerase sigma-70 factor (ECF subfamily)
LSEASWDAWYETELPRIYNFFRYRVGDGPVAEDLTSVTFEKAWAARHRFRRDRAGFGTWVLAIARNVAVDHFRRTRRHAPLEEAMDVPGGERPDAIAEHHSDLERLAWLLDRLGERERELIALKYGADLDNRAIARLTGLTESNVGTILHRTISGLRAGWHEGETR